MHQRVAESDRDDRIKSRGRIDALNDGIGMHRIRPPANAVHGHGSPWSLAPWPVLEIRDWIADRMDRWLPGRGNRGLLRVTGDDPQARLTVVTHACVLPALREVREQLAGEGYAVALDYEAMRIVLRVRCFNGGEATYAVTGLIYQAPVFSLADLQRPKAPERRARLRIESRGRRREFGLERCGEDAMYRDALLNMRNQILF